MEAPKPGPPHPSTSLMTRRVFQGMRYTNARSRSRPNANSMVFCPSCRGRLPSCSRVGTKLRLCRRSRLCGMQAVLSSKAYTVRSILTMFCTIVMQWCHASLSFALSFQYAQEISLLTCSLSFCCLLGCYELPAAGGRCGAQQPTTALVLQLTLLVPVAGTAALRAAAARLPCWGIAVVNGGRGGPAVVLHGQDHTRGLLSMRCQGEAV